MTWEMIELKEGEPVVFLAVHALRWNWQEWGEPKVGFVDSDEPDSADVQALVEAVREVMSLPPHGYSAEMCAEIQAELAAALEPFTDDE